MRAFHILPAILSVMTVPALADTGSEQRFEHDGITYVYEVEERGDRRILSGRQYLSGARFRLVVREGRVSGRVNGSAVYFRLADIDEAQIRAIELASN